MNKQEISRKSHLLTGKTKQLVCEMSLSERANRFLEHLTHELAKDNIIVQELCFAVPKGDYSMSSVGQETGLSIWPDYYTDTQINGIDNINVLHPYLISNYWNRYGTFERREVSQGNRSSIRIFGGVWGVCASILYKES